MGRSRGFGHPVARRAALASLTVLASSAIGLVAAPAFSQIVIPIGGPLLGSSQSAGVTNSGGASANSGGNTAVGNGSTNTASAEVPGGAVSVPISLGAPTNNSEGSATITSGPATASGNAADTSVGQSNASGSQVSSFLASQSQGAGVTNTGGASANTGGNAAIGNASQNNASVTQQVSGGLLGVGVSLGGPTNNSTGSATINSGAANAAGNTSGTQVGQAATWGGGGPGGPGGIGVLGAGGPGSGAGPCGAGRFVAFQDANVANRGQAQATTGNNTAIGNASTNDASVSVPQTVSGGLIGVGVSLGGPVNNSSGTAVINTGPATANGNDSVTTVGQTEGCPQIASLAGRQPVVVPAGHVAVQGQRPGTATLARTGLDTGDLGMIAGGLLGAGMLLIASQRRRLAARHAAVPLAGFGLGLGADEWDRAVR